MKKKYKNKNDGRKKLAIEILFWLHFPIVVIWFGLFAIPRFIWPNRVIFHFWFITGIMSIQLIWGLILIPYTKKVDIICPLTTWMQKLRGYPIKSKKNHNHSFIAELLQRLKIPINYKGVNILLIITLIIVTVRYFWFN